MTARTSSGGTGVMMSFINTWIQAWKPHYYFSWLQHGPDSFLLDSLPAPVKREWLSELLQVSRMGNRTWVASKKNEQVSPHAAGYSTLVPKIGYLEFQMNPETFFDVLKLVSLFMRDSADTIWSVIADTGTIRVNLAFHLNELWKRERRREWESESERDREKEREKEKWIGCVFLNGRAWPRHPRLTNTQTGTRTDTHRRMLIYSIANSYSMTSANERFIPGSREKDRTGRDRDDGHGMAIRSGRLWKTQEPKSGDFFLEGQEQRNRWIVDFGVNKRRMIDDLLSFIFRCYCSPSERVRWRNTRKPTQELYDKETGRRATTKRGLEHSDGSIRKDLGSEGEEGRAGWGRGVRWEMSSLPGRGKHVPVRVAVHIFSEFYECFFCVCDLVRIHRNT